MPRPACRPALRVLTRIDDLECLRVVVLAGARFRRGVEIVEQGGMRLPGFPRQFQEGRNCRRILLVRGILSMAAAITALSAPETSNISQPLPKSINDQVKKMPTRRDTCLPTAQIYSVFPVRYI
jgi:hypothetical protein